MTSEKQYFVGRGSMKTYFVRVGTHGYASLRCIATSQIGHITAPTGLLWIILIFALAACEPAAKNQAGATYIPFPTTTIGYTIRGVLTTPQATSGSQGSYNPATVEALAHRPTATPNTGICPPQSDAADLGEVPATGEEISREIVRFLSAGGSPTTLESALRDDWGILGESGFVRADIDLTGDAIPEIILGYVVPTEGGVLLIAGCEEGHYVLRQEIVLEENTPPILIQLGDTTNDGQNDLTFATQHCDEDDECLYQTHLLTWKMEEWRFVSLLGATIESDALPEVIDTDDDLVGEIVIRLERRGSVATGPLRTGLRIYDWNGSVYVLSIVQLDPPRYRIQVIQAADRQFMDGNTAEAISLYQLAFTDETLRNWFDDEETILDSYILYRLLLAYAVGNSEETQGVYQRIQDTYLDPEQTPIYVELSRAFWDSFQHVSNLTTACRGVQTVIAEHPETLDLLNRYGSRNPTYTNQDLCPF